MAAALAPTALGMPIRHYRVAEARHRSIVAGAAITERFVLMTDRIENVPWPLALLGRAVSVLPPDGVLATIELSLVWHAPGREGAGRTLWDAIRYEWRDRATRIAAPVDPRGELNRVFRAGRRLQPRVRLMIPVRSPVPLSETKPIYLWR
jgi:hypothetical protein